MEEQDEEKYNVGFNYGYQLAKHLPDILGKIYPSIEEKDSYYEGVISEKEQFEFEKKRIEVNKQEIKGNPEKDIEIQKGV